MDTAATREVVEIVGVVAALSVIMGGIIVALLKNFFVAKADCKENTTHCHTEVCKKIDSINTKIAGMEDERQKHTKLNDKRNLWIVRSLTTIGEKVGANLEHFPDD